MRLIDADNLKPTEGMFIYQTEDRDTVIATEAYRWELIKREAPTVKAIPIEWIRNYVSIWISEPYKNFALNMITLWEKENGRSE